MDVILMNKITKNPVRIYISNVSSEKAESICESWGWNYSDGHHSYWMDITDSKIGGHELYE